MSKERMFRFSLLACLMIVFSFAIGSCLNPINFDETSLPRIPVDVSGSIDVSIKDVAVFWLINRTKNVDVVEFNIDREKITADEADYAYPINTAGMPKAGSSLASYHTPTEKMYQIRVAYTGSGGSGVIGPLNVQFPRAQDYRYYLYWTQDGQLVLVNEDKMQDLPPDPDANWPDPQPSSVNAHTLVIMNITPDQNLDAMQFEKNGGGAIYLLQGKPRAKDQARILLGTGDFETTAFYTRNGPKQAGPKTTIITAESGSMAVRTNYLYFYKTNSGDYSMSPVWPPIPNDASDDNKPEDALTDDQGILEITNNATPSLPHDLIARVNIDGDEYPSTTNNTAYMVPGDVKRYILPVGEALVSFKPTDQTYYGQTIPREITSKAVTKLSYTNNMGNPDFIPEDTPNGAGLIRITNNTTGVVGSVTVYDRSELSKYISIPYEDFTPPYPIQYAKVGRVVVYGTDECPLREGISQIIQVLLETTNNGMVVVERVAALKGQVVDIVIEEGSLNPSSRTGSKVTVSNNTVTPTNILGMYVYNQVNVASSAVYYMDIPNPGTKQMYVLSSTGLPIVQGETYKAQLSVYGNGRIAMIEKDFTPDGRLYSTNPDSNERFITLTQSDLPSELVENFKPVTGITTTPSPYRVNVWYTTDPNGSNPVVTYSSDFNLKSVVTVQPAPPDLNAATTREPIEWTLLPVGASGKVTVGSDGSFRVKHQDHGAIPATPADSTVTVQAVIRNAAGSVTSKSDYTGNIEVQLVYQRVGTTTKLVIGFDLTGNNVEIQQGTTLDLRSLASIDPTDANIDGTPITADDLTWVFSSNGTSSYNGSSISGSLLTAGSAIGTVNIRATMPASKTNSGSDLRKTKDIIIIALPPTIEPITGISMAGTPPYNLNYYTKTVGASGSETVYNSDILALAVKISPSYATNRSPLNWNFVSGAGSAVELTSNPGTLKVVSAYGLPSASTVSVRVTVPNGGGTGVDFISSPFTINLVKHHSRVISGSELSLKTGEIKVNEAIALNTLVNPFPSGAGFDSIPTVNDLVWEHVSGPGTLSNGIVTGTGVGTVTVRATLPGARNLENEVSTTTTILVNPLPPSTPTGVTFRIFKVRESGDTYTDTLLGLFAGMTYYPGATEAQKKTGRTGINWGDEAKDATYYKNTETYYLKKYYPIFYKYFGNLNLTDGTFADVTIPWPTGSHTGYNLFFHEKDNRVRGYVNPYGNYNPKIDKNFVFYLDFRYVYDNFLIPMVGKNQVTESTAGAVKVIPIYYDSHRNVGAIMKAQGVNKPPVADYTYLSK